MTTTTRQAQADQLHCPGCRDTVLFEPPTGHPELGSCHHDGSVLCGQRAGGPVVEPIEDPDW